MSQLLKEIKEIYFDQKIKDLYIDNIKKINLFNIIKYMKINKK